MFESKLEFRELKEELEQELLENANLKTQMKSFYSENETFNKKVIFFFLWACWHQLMANISHCIHHKTIFVRKEKKTIFVNDFL